MREENFRIGQLIKLKNNIDSGVKLDSQKVSAEIEQITRKLWTDIDLGNINEQDLAEISSLHEFLLNENIKISDTEFIRNNNEVLEGTIDLREAFGKLKDDSSVNMRADGIYFVDGVEIECYFIGDIHSDSESIDRILVASGFVEKILSGRKVNLIFLGDYVDRGKTHLKTTEKLLIIKYLFPDTIYLLKGNHDRVKIVDGEVELLLKRVEIDEDYFYIYINELTKANVTFNNKVVKLYEQFFNQLAFVCVVVDEKNVLMGVHGGIPRPMEGVDGGCFDHISSLDDISCNRLKDELDKDIEDNMLWSDPIESDGWDVEGLGRFKFTQRHFDEFVNRFGIDYIVRGHQAFEEGIKTFYGGRLFSVFSSGMGSNETSYDKICPKILKYCNGNVIEVELG